MYTCPTLNNTHTHTHTYTQGDVSVRFYYFDDDGGVATRRRRQRRKSSMAGEEYGRDRVGDGAVTAKVPCRLL
jgi:hypothetical protein